MMTRTGSTGIQRASARENTSVQNTGAVVVGSGVRSPAGGRVSVYAYTHDAETYVADAQALLSCPSSACFCVT